MYSTCVSAWRVPLMNVTAERSGQSPWRATTSSAPSPFCTVITVAPGQRPASRAGRLEVGALARDDHEVGSGSSAGSVAARTRDVKSARPLTRIPSRSSAARMLLAPA